LIDADIRFDHLKFPDHAADVGVHEERNARNADRAQRSPPETLDRFGGLARGFEDDLAMRGELPSDQRGHERPAPRFEQGFAQPFFHG